MNVGLSKRAGSLRSPGSVRVRPTEPRAWYPLVLIFALVSLGIFAGGIFSYRNYERRFRTGFEQQLAAITDLEVEQIVLWGGDTNGETYVPRFTFHGFQYVELTGYPGKPDLAAFYGKWLRELRQSQRPSAVRVLRTEGDRVALAVDSGTYRFATGGSR